MANKVLKKAQSKEIKIKYNKLGKWDELKLIGFTDSSFRNDKNFTKSIGGRILFLANKEGKCSPLSWKSKTIQQVCKSVKSADLGIEEGILKSKMFHKIMTGKAKVKFQFS